jgi:hypothetical protein
MVFASHSTTGEEAPVLFLAASHTAEILHQMHTVQLQSTMQLVHQIM